jgi:hypothetical protein
MPNNERASKIIHSTKKISPSRLVDYVGQIGGIDTDNEGNIAVFHRASRKWTYEYVSQ